MGRGGKTMDRATIIWAMMMTAFILFIIPRSLSMNKEKLFVYAIAWLVIFLSLGLIYKYFGPFGNASNFVMPAKSSDAKHELRPTKEGDVLLSNPQNVPGALPDIRHQ